MCVYVRKQWRNRMATWIRAHQSAPETFVEQQKMTIRHCSSINFIVFYQILKGNEMLHDVSTHNNEKRNDIFETTGDEDLASMLTFRCENIGANVFILLLLLLRPLPAMARMSIASSKFMIVSFRHHSQRKYLLTRRFNFNHRSRIRWKIIQAKCNIYVGPKRRVNWSIHSIG